MFRTAEVSPTRNRAYRHDSGPTAAADSIKSVGAASPSDSDTTSSPAPSPGKYDLPPLRPVISDMLRTRYCVPRSVFLVEGIDSALTSGGWRALRLMLGDGELCVQALLRKDLHLLVDGGMIKVGSYVRLDRFEVQWRVVEEGDGGVGAGAMGMGKGKGTAKEMVYLGVSQLDVLGYDEAYADEEGSETGEAGMGDVDYDAEMYEAVEEPARHGTPTKPGLLKTQDTPDDDWEDMISSDDDFEVMVVDEMKATQRRDAASRLEASYRQTSSLPWKTNDPTQPLKLTPLRSIPNLPYKQNWSVNVLAIVVSLSEIEPSNIAPFRQRTARLADPTTTKHVQLSVLLDPEEFCPAIGSAVLLVGVKNHTFDGGCLKKYSNERPKGGGKWWLEDPVDLGWCEVSALKSWWDGRASDIS